MVSRVRCPLLAPVNSSRHTSCVWFAMTQSDQRMKQDIEDELRWDPKVATAQVEVRVDNGAVSLLGTVDTYVQMWAVEDATKRVSGVRAISTVTLSGNAAHWESIEYAANAAWTVPGVTEVVDHVQLTMTI